VKAKRKKTSRTKPHKEGVGGFFKLTRSEAEWLKQDSEARVKQAKELPPLMAARRADSNVAEESATKQQILEAERFVHHLRLAKIQAEHELGSIPISRLHAS
jgi:hypothetical protein